MSNTTSIETLKLYANKRTGKDQGTMQFRTPKNIAEMISWCSMNSHIWVRSQNGDARTVKVNGAVRTWKRDPNRVEVPCKYGMYEYFTLEARHISEVLIPIGQPSALEVSHA